MVHGFKIGATLDALLTFEKSGGIKEYHKEEEGGPGRNQVTKMVLVGSYELHWSRCF